jgi:hypothetical protein
MQTISNWTYASFFFGLLTISFIIWNRLIRVRLPRELFIANEYDFTFFIVFSLTIIFGIIFLYYFLNLIKYLPRNPGRIIKFLNSMVQKLEHFMIYQFLIKLYFSFIEGPQNFYNLIYNSQYQKIDKILEFTGNLLVDFFFNKSLRLKILYLIIFVFPRILICVCFFIEVFIFQQLNYFYKILPIIIIPTFAKAYFLKLQYFSEEFIIYYRKFFDIVYTYVGNGMYDMHVYPYKLTDIEQINTQEYLLKDDKILNIYEFYVNIYIITYQVLDERYNKYKNILFTIYYGIYFLGFLGYILILTGFY